MIIKLNICICFLTSFVLCIQSYPVKNYSGIPSKVIVQSTNYNQTKIDTVITNSAAEFKSLPLPKGNFRRNDVKFGHCEGSKNIVHNEHILIDSDGPSTLSGLFEFYIDSPITISCIEVLDKMPPGTGAEVSLKQGGPGYNWFYLDVKGKYARGINFIVTAYGVPDLMKIKFRKQ